MKNEEILKKAIEKAKKNGWQPEDLWKFCPKPNYDDFIDWLIKENIYMAYIFSHDFLNAFFKIEMPKDGVGGIDWAICGDCKKPLGGVKHHAQQMILEKEPLQYIKKFLGV